MTEAEVKDNVITFIFGGQETTSTALTWAIYLLSQSPEWCERLTGEAENAADGSGQEDALVLTRAVVEEALRLYPPIIGITRTAMRRTDWPAPRSGSPRACWRLKRTASKTPFHGFLVFSAKPSQAIPINVRIEVQVFADANARQRIGPHGASGKCPSTSNFRRPTQRRVVTDQELSAAAAFQGVHCAITRSCFVRR